MKNKYFDKVTKLLERTSPKLATQYRLEFKNVFGAVGAYVNGKIFITCGKFGVALKLPPEVLNNLFKNKGARRLKYFLQGHTKKEYAIIPLKIICDKGIFKKLLNKSIKYALDKN